jgi:hypothetical protein
MKFGIRIMIWVALTAPVIAMAQGQQTLAVTGYSGSVPALQVSGRNYVEVEALARLINGALSFSGNKIVLTLPGSDGNGSNGNRSNGNAPAANAPAAAPSPAANSGFSREFLRAGIEAMSTIREWHSALASAIGNGYPVTEDGLSQYSDQAMTNLRLAQTAANTDSDQQAVQFVANEYRKMKQLSDKYVAKRENMNYTAPGALKNDPLNQSIIACGKSLGAMAASGQFTDDGSCD